MLPEKIARTPDLQPVCAGRLLPQIGFAVGTGELGTDTTVFSVKTGNWIATLRASDSFRTSDGLGSVAREVAQPPVEGWPRRSLAFGVKLAGKAHC